VSSELTMAWLALPDIKRRQLFSTSLPNSWNFGFDYHLVCIIVMLTYIPGA
jgi:very-long-chain (3R)-3-hydroxyacyl-CoA dehydratase